MASPGSRERLAHSWPQSRLLASLLSAAFRSARRAFGQIVTIASSAGLKPYRFAALCRAKQARSPFRALALEFAKTKVTVNAVCPGFTETDLVTESIATIQAASGCSAQEARAGLESFNPQGRLISPTEVAAAVVWLCLADSGSITGQSIAVAGGEVM